MKSKKEKKQKKNQKARAVLAVALKEDAKKEYRRNNRIKLV